MNKIFAMCLFSMLFIGCSRYGNNSKPDSEVRKHEKIKYFVDGKERELVFNFAPIKKDNQERVWKKIHLSKKFKIGGIENELFDSPSQIKIDSLENFYVLDNGYLCVKKFDESGNYLKSFGKEGSGPKEFRLVFDFDLLPDGTLALVDPNLNKLVVFEDDNFFEYKPVNMSLKLCFSTKKEITMLQFIDFINIPPISKINYKTNENIEYENFVIPQNNNISFFGYLMGDIHRIDDSKIIYISSVLGYVVIYNSSGNIIDRFSLINDVNTPLHLESRRGGIGFPRITEYLFRRSVVDGNKLYILNNCNLVKDGKYVVDVYSIKEKKYLYSIQLSGLGDIIYTRFSKDKLFVIRENTEIEVYNYTLEF